MVHSDEVHNFTNELLLFFVPRLYDVQLIQIKIRCNKPDRTEDALHEART
jgi:hypothetical protein